MAGDGNGSAGRFSDVLGAAFHKATVAAAPHLQQAHDDRITAFLEGLEARVAPLLAPVLADVLADPNTPEEVRPLLEAVAAPTHKFDSSLISIGLAAILYPFLTAALAPHVASVAQQAWSRDQSLVLSPAELALSVIKNTYDHARAIQEAGDNGLDPARFQVMVDNTGEPPGIAELLLAYRRGEIDVARLQHGIRQSRVRDEWQDVILALRYTPPPPGEVLAGAVQNHLSLADAQTKVAQAGIDPVNFGWMYETHGRPPSPLEIARLVHRGITDRATFDQAVLESDIKNKYIDMLFEASTYIPPVRSVMAMLRSGAITDAEATTLFHENGVRDADIAGYLAEAHHTKATSVKELSQAQTLRMYGAKFITRADATARLQRLGLDAATITLLLDFADEAQHERYVNAVVTRVHARYVAYKLTDTEATNALNADGIPAAAVTDLMKLWRIERDANIHVLTPASIVGAYRRQEIGPAETKARLLAGGVQQRDLAIVVADGFPPAKPNPAAVAAVVNA